VSNLRLYVQELLAFGEDANQLDDEDGDALAFAHCLQRGSCEYYGADVNARDFFVSEHAIAL
jgi:hypothetical protein